MECLRENYIMPLQQSPRNMLSWREAFIANDAWLLPPCDLAKVVEQRETSDGESSWLYSGRGGD